MNKSPNKALIAECDGLIQAIACLGWCALSGYPAEVGHHLIKKSKSKFFQHDLRNIVPLTNCEHTGDSWSCAELKPDIFDVVFENRFPEQWKWAQAHRNEYHKAPDRDALLETRKKLRAFLAAGKPYTFDAGQE